MRTTPKPSPAASADADRAGVGRGVALTVPAALLGVAAAVRVDAWLDLPGWGRGMLAVTWLAAAAVAGWGWTAIPGRPGGRFGPVVAGLLAAMSLAVVPAAGDRVRRLFLPFYTPLPDLPFRLTASSGDPAVARGAAVTLTAFAEPTDPGLSPPDTATLVVRDRPGGPERRLSMTGDGRGVFRATRSAVTDGFEYLIEIGPVRTGWHTVTTVDPVGLAAGSTIRVEPPEYASASPRTVEGFVAFDGPQFGRAEFDLRLTRPATDASLVWHPDGENPTPVRLAASADRLSLRATLPLSKSGRLVLTLSAERDVRTVISIPVRVVPDDSPQFETATGLGIGPWEVSVDGVIRGVVGVRDDIAVTAVRLEYEVNGSRPTVELIPLSRFGPRWAAGSFSLPLSGRVKVGDTLRVRVRAADNRSLPDDGLGPQEATYPPDGGATYRVVRSPKNTLVEQEVSAQRDRLKKQLAAAASLTQSGRRVSEVDAELVRSAPGSGFTVDQTVRLTEARDDTTTTADRLASFADEIAVVPDLRSVAAAIREVTNGPLRSAVNHLRVALATGHEPEVAAAARQLRVAADGLTFLAAGADRFAQLRLDRRALQAIAADLRSAADPSTGRDDAVRRLAATVASSPVLSVAADGLDLDAIRETVTQMARLADDHCRLATAIAETARTARDQALAGLAAKQSALAEKVAALAGRTEVAARIAGASPISPRPGIDAVALLKAGRTTDAAAEGQKLAQELDRLAEEFARAAVARSDTRTAARQLALWQADVRQRVLDAGPLADFARERFAAEQRSIREALSRVTIPPGPTSLADAWAAALFATAKATDTLDAVALTEAADKLRGFADRAPGREARLKASRDVVDRLFREQGSIGRLATEAAADRQLALARELDAVDVLEFGHRRAAAADAARRAADDLRAGLTLDISASQSHARRQLDRFRQALAGDVPDDERAIDIARLQREIADAADKLPPHCTANDLRPLAARQKELVRSVNALTTSEATSLFIDAREAVAQADLAARRADRAEFQKLARVAAGSTGRLAARLAGADSDLDRVRAIAARPGPHDSDELALVRSGAAQTERKRAANALAKLRQAADADRPALQRDATEAVNQLAEAMARNGDRSTAHPLPPKPAPTDVITPGIRNGPPTRADADAARELARRQRELRDEVTRTAADLARGVQDARHRVEREELARRSVTVAGDLARTDGPRLGVDADRLSRAADAVRRAADAITLAGREADAGRPANATDAHRRAAEAFAETIAATAYLVQASHTGDPAARPAVTTLRRAEALLKAADPRAVEVIEEAARQLGDMAWSPKAAKTANTAGDTLWRP